CSHGLCRRGDRKSFLARRRRCRCIAWSFPCTEGNLRSSSYARATCARWLVSTGARARTRSRRVHHGRGSRDKLELIRPRVMPMRSLHLSAVGGKVLVVRSTPAAAPLPTGRRECSDECATTNGHARPVRRARHERRALRWQHLSLEHIGI